MTKVKIAYQDKVFEIPKGEGSLLDHIRLAGIPIAAPCGGKGTCNKCSVRLKAQGDIDYKEVLACREFIDGDVIVEVPAPAEAMILSEAYWPDLQIEWNNISDDQAYGIAVDIGTTTVVAFLEDLNTHKNIEVNSFLNPQKSFGADVVSRIQAIMQNPDSQQEQKKMISQSLEKAFIKLTADNDIPIDAIKKISIAGNNPMLHLLKGSDPRGLAIFPFTPEFVEEQNPSSAELGFENIKKAEICLLPSLSAYIGADIIAGIAATEMPDDDQYSLFLDIGTNGEMALGNKNRILTCATAAGPAFEGANISCGLGGVNGAIHSFDAKGFKTIGLAPPTGLCGSGLVDVVAWLLNTNQLDPSGYLEEPVVFLDTEKAKGNSALQLTPQDIREVQLAKGAIAAGIQTLIKEAGISESEIGRVYLAGGFGYAIHVESAARIGLIPESLKDRVIRAGNLAGLGARLALHSEEFKIRIKDIQKKAEYFELSNHMGFNEAFVMEMGFK